MLSNDFTSSRERNEEKKLVQMMMMMKINKVKCFFSTFDTLMQREMKMNINNDDDIYYKNN